MRLLSACAAMVFSVALVGCKPATTAAETSKVASPSNSGSSAPTASSALTCNQSISASMPFTSAATPDLVTVRSIAAPPLSAKALEADTSDNGGLCEHASLVYSIHSGATGSPHYEVILPLARMDVGALRPSPAELTAILQSMLTQTKVVSTERAPSADPANPGLSTSTSLSEADYAALKERKLPLLCYPSSVHDVSCVYADPQGPDSFNVKEMVVLSET